MAYDFDDFLSSVKYLDKDDVLKTAYKEHKMLDKSSSRFSTEDRLAMQKSIQGLLYWIETGQRSETMHERDFAKLKPICENLIKKNQMKSEALSAFE